MSVSIKGLYGAVLELPYPEDYTEVVKIKNILELFPDVLNNDDAIKYLILYKNIVINEEIVFHILIKGSADVVKTCLDNEKFNTLRKKISPINLCQNELRNIGETCNLAEMGKLFAETFLTQ